MKPRLNKNSAAVILAAALLTACTTIPSNPERIVYDLKVMEAGAVASFGVYARLPDCSILNPPVLCKDKGVVNGMLVIAEKADTSISIAEALVRSDTTDPTDLVRAISIARQAVQALEVEVANLQNKVKK